jgi:hypothetical protein
MPEMDSTLWMIVAAVVVIVILIFIFRYPREIGLKLRGWGFEAALSAKGHAEDAKDPDAVAARGRNVSIGGKADRNTIVTGDGNKIG